MFKIYLSRTVSPGIGIHLPASIEEIRDAYAMLNGLDWQDERVFGAAIEMRKQDTLAEMINLSCNLDKFEYLPGVTTVTKLGKHLIDRYADMVPEKCKAYPDYDQG